MWEFNWLHGGRGWAATERLRVWIGNTDVVVQGDKVRFGKNKRKTEVVVRTSLGGGEPRCAWRGLLCTISCCLLTMTLFGPLVFHTVLRACMQGFPWDSYLDTIQITIHPNPCVKWQIHCSSPGVFMFVWKILTQTSFELTTDCRLIPIKGWIAFLRLTKHQLSLFCRKV